LAKAYGKKTRAHTDERRAGKMHPPRRAYVTGFNTHFFIVISAGLLVH
jgi:hypothetical protein